MRSSVQKLVSLETCPCCGYESLARKDRFCGVCRWENDGHDNALAFRYSVGNHTNLNLARYRFLLSGAAPVLSRGRIFRVDESGGFIEEVSGTGQVIYRGPIPFVDYSRLGHNEVAAMPIRSKKRA